MIADDSQQPLMVVGFATTVKNLKFWSINQLDDGVTMLMLNAE